MKESAAVILCAGKGTRMGDAPINKVCFDCAGIPVIRRVVQNMREGGVNRFVIVVGHLAGTVMSALDGEKGVLYAFQKEQKGTGHAALCGLKVLDDIGFNGPVIVSMGDKIVRSEVIKGILKDATKAKVVWGVQMREANPNGGRVVMNNDKLAGVVELADAGLMAIKALPEVSWSGKLAELGLNPKKAAKVIDKAKLPGVMKSVPDKRFGQNAAEILLAKYANAGLYCFDASSAVEAIGGLKSDNAQGEIYLTDTLEWFASRGEAIPYEVTNADDMLTYSTRPELRKMARKFMRKASECLQDDSCAAWHEVIEAFIKRFGDKPVVLTSAPGRVNIMGRHIDHRGGSINVMTTSQSTYFVISPRDDDKVTAANINSAFPEGTFSISEELKYADRSLEPNAKNWLAFLDSPEPKAALAATRGSWMNYVKSAILRFQYSEEFPLCGMDMMAGGNVPPAAGLSSSSTIVVAVAEAVVALNELNVSTRTFIDMCCEGEWFVGSRGGAGDHAAIKCSVAGKIIHLGFKPFTIGDTFPFSSDYAIIVADSGEKAKKSEGAGKIYNSRVEDYESALETIRSRFPERSFPEFRDIAKLPDAECKKVLSVLKGSVKNIATYGVEECRRAEKCTELLKYGDYEGLGALMKESHDGDRIGGGKYECSTVKIDGLCDQLNVMPGVLGSEIVGAGLGGSFIVLVRKEAVDSILSFLKGQGIAAISSVPSGGSKVKF